LFSVLWNLHTICGVFIFFVFELGFCTGQTKSKSDGRTDGGTGKTRNAAY